jgi:hypothetical protein
MSAHSDSGNKSRRPRIRRARPLLVAAGAVLVVGGCQGRALGHLPSPCDTNPAAEGCVQGIPVQLVDMGLPFAYDLHVADLEAVDLSKPTD